MRAVVLPRVVECRPHRSWSVVVAVSAGVVLVAGCGTDAAWGGVQRPATTTSVAPMGTESAATTSRVSRRSSTGQADPAEEQTAEQETGGDAPGGVPERAQPATVARIVDGDTLELSADRAGPALSTTSQIDVRLLEIDTPETVDPNEPEQCYGQQAAAQLKQLAPPGSTVWVQRDEELTDRYGRYLLYLWNSEGTFVNLSLAKDGYARAVLYQPNDKHWDTISAAENDAQTTQVGLWGVCSSFGAPVATPEPTGPAPGQGDTGGAYLFPPPPPDKDCGPNAAGDFPVRPGAPHRFDRDGDGIGCES